MNLFTGITSISNFEAIHKALSSQIASISLWRGPKKVVLTSSRNLT